MILVDLVGFVELENAHTVEEFERKLLKLEIDQKFPNSSLLHHQNGGRTAFEILAIGERLVSTRTEQ